jgi:hypothetical protein
MSVSGETVWIEIVDSKGKCADEREEILFFFFLEIIRETEIN